MTSDGFMRDAWRSRLSKRADYFKTGGYSREFTPSKQGHRSYLLDRIPVPLWTIVREKAKRERDKPTGGDSSLALAMSWVHAVRH